MPLRNVFYLLCLSLLAACSTPNQQIQTYLGPFPDFDMEELSDVEDQEFVAYYDDGTLKQHTWIVNGCFDNMLRTYYENGKPKLAIPITNCKANGVVKSYHPNGNLDYELYVVNGVPDGSFLIYHNSDSNYVAKRASVKNGHVEGLVEEISDDGETLKRGAIRNGKAMPF